MADREQRAEKETDNKDCENVAASLVHNAEIFERTLMVSKEGAELLRTSLSNITSNRKRHLSLPTVSESEAKKLRSTDSSNEKIADIAYERNIVPARTRRNIMKKSNKVTDENDQLEVPSVPTVAKQAAANISKVSKISKKGRSKKKSDNSEVERDTQLVKNKENSQDASVNNSSLPLILSKIDEVKSSLVTRMDDLRTDNKNIMSTLQKQIDGVRTELNTRLDGLCKKVEAKVTESVNKLFENKMKTLKEDIDSEIKKARKSLEESDKSVHKKVKSIEETIIPTMEETIGDELDDLSKRIRVLENRREMNSDNNVHVNQNTKGEDLSFVIKYLKEREDENVVDRVHNLITQGLKLYNINVESAERLESRSEHPGVIVVKVSSTEQKKAVLSKKMLLKSSCRYEKVYTEPTLTTQQRIMNANFRRIIKNNGENQMYMKGSRKYSSEDRDNSYSHNNDTGRELSYNRQGSYNERRSNNAPRRNNGYSHNRHNDWTYTDTYSSNRGSYNEREYSRPNNDRDDNSRSYRRDSLRHCWRCGFWNVNGWNDDILSKSHILRATFLTKTVLDIIGIA